MTILEDFISIFFELSIHFITSPSLFLLLLLGFFWFCLFCFRVYVCVFFPSPSFCHIDHSVSDFNVIAL